MLISSADEGQLLKHIFKDKNYLGRQLECILPGKEHRTPLKSMRAKYCKNGQAFVKENVLIARQYRMGHL